MSKSLICREDMMAPMLVACPSFTPIWDAFLSDWVGNSSLYEDGADGSLPLYLALSDLADHLVDKLEAGTTDNFTAVFAIVEQWILHGDHYVSEAAVVGLLEDLTARHRYRHLSRESFVKWLRPASRKWWNEVIDFWERLDRDQFCPLSID